jgi:hypothetical protein
VRGKRIANDGKTMRCYLNYSGETRKFVYPHESGLDVLTKQPINKDQNVSNELLRLD